MPKVPSEVWRISSGVAYGIQEVNVADLALTVSLLTDVIYMDKAAQGKRTPQ